MKISENSRAQTISTDAVIAVVLFTMAIIFFFALSYNPKDPVERLEGESTKLSGEIACEQAKGSLLHGQDVNETVMENLARMSCDELKRCLGLSSNLCIYFQDEDNNLIKIANVNSKEVYGIGCPSFWLQDGAILCGQDPTPP